MICDGLCILIGVFNFELLCVVNVEVIVVDDVVMMVVMCLLWEVFK